MDETKVQYTRSVYFPASVSNADENADGNLGGKN